MSLNLNVTLNLYSMLILLVMLIHSLRQHDKSNFQSKLYLWLIQITMISLVLDILSRFDGNPTTYYSLLNQIGNFLIFMISPILPSLWVMYVHDEIFHEPSKTKRLIKPLLVLFSFNTGMVILSQFTHWYYMIDSNNIYHRGPLYVVPIILTFGLIFSAFILILTNKKRIDKNHFVSLLVFAIPPTLCVLYTTFFYGISLVINSVVISILIVGLTIQNHNLNIDYLTGINNRKRLDAYINEKIKRCSKGRTFSAIMLDLDNFKSINDKYGHDVGDTALQISVKLLNDCLRSVDFIARFGGDEFCIVLDVSRSEELQMIVERIIKVFRAYNETGTQMYQIEMSMGYAVYDFDTHMSSDVFEKKLDELMYSNKRTKKDSAGHTPPFEYETLDLK